MQAQQLKLPPINPSKELQSRLPNDTQLLLDNQQPQGTNKNLKIWEKKTSSCRSALQRFDKYQTAVDDKYVPVNSYNTKQKKLIESAMEIIQMRKKNKDLVGKNQTIVDILEQKKEMFLVTMTHGIIQKEIQNLTSQAEEREKALEESSKILENDNKDFQQYFQKYKNQTKKIEDQFEKQVQKRLLKEQQIKSKQITVNSLRAEKSRNEESISSYIKYKKFLNQLPPKEWIEEKEEKKKNKIGKIKQKLKTEWVMSSSNLSSTLSKKSSAPIDQFQKLFQKIVQNGQNEQIQQILNDEDMYFKEPSELIQFFNNLQQTNLFNIQNAHYAQQKYQQLKVKSQEKKIELKTAYQLHKQQKKSLQRQLSQLDNQIRQLKKKKEQNSLLDEKDSKDIKSTIASQYQSIKETMHNYIPEIQYNNAESLSLLSAIEICMERLWQRLRECYAQNPKLIKQIKNQLERKKNNDKREEATNNNKLEEEKRKNRNVEKKEPVVKITGRIDMKRSPPQERIIVKKVETSGKDMDDDKKYLVE